MLDGKAGSAESVLHEFEKVIRPLRTQAQMPTPADFLAHVIEQLQTSNLLGQNAELLQSLEELKADSEHDNALGFYVVMILMATAVGIAESMRTMQVDDACSCVTRQVQDFINKRLNCISPAQSPQAEKLIVMAKAAMKVPFTFSCFVGKGMPSSLSHSMMKWSMTASKKETKALQTRLEAALGSFIDAWISKPESGFEDQEGAVLSHPSQA